MLLSFIVVNNNGKIIREQYLTNISVISYSITLTNKNYLYYYLIVLLFIHDQCHIYIPYYSILLAHPLNSSVIFSLISNSFNTFLSHLEESLQEEVQLTSNLNFLKNLIIRVKLWGSGHLHLLFFSALTPLSLRVLTDFCSHSWGKYHRLHSWKRCKCLFTKTNKSNM